jgi:hypothetical protein
MKSFRADFIRGLIGLPLATIVAVWVSYVLIITIFGPLLWLPIFYILVLIWVLRPAFWGYYGRLAALGVCLVAWAAYAQSQAIAAHLKANEIAKENARLPTRSGIDAVVFHADICDAICTELLANRRVKTVFLMGRSVSRALTLATDGPCDGASALASKLLRDNNRFGLCIRDEVARGISGRELLFEQNRRFDRPLWGEHADMVALTVSEWDSNKWRPIYERSFGVLYVLQYFPAFAADAFQHRIEWWRRAIKIGEPADMKEVVGQVLGIKLTGEFDTTVVEPFGNGGTITRFNVIKPALPADLAAEIDRLSRDGDPAVLRQAANSITRFIKENKTYEPIRASLQRLILSPDEGVKPSAYQAVAYAPVAIDDDLLRFIMEHDPDWRSSALGGLLSRLSEDQLKPYEAQIAGAHFESDKADNRRSQNSAREALSLALPALRLEALKQIYDRCSELSEASLRIMGETIDAENRRMPDAKLLKLKATWAPCALRRMATFSSYSLRGIARGLAWIGDGPAAAAQLEEVLASHRFHGVDETNLQGVDTWLRNNQKEFEKRWAHVAPLP